MERFFFRFVVMCGADEEEELSVIVERIFDFYCCY